MEKLTLQEAKEYFERVNKKCQFDNEVAHELEDECAEKFIRSVSLGLYEPKELLEVSKVVTEILDIEYNRWYA